MTYRVVGSIESQLEGWDWSQADAAARLLKTVEDFAAECSFIKVFASETLDYVTDEGVQIHGGYGFHQDYAVEHAYRDSRINRIFEGTNEINRLLATGMFLKKAQRGQLALVEAVKKLQAEILAGPSLEAGAATGKFAEETKLVENTKKIGLFLIGVAYQKFGEKVEAEQEVMANITDVLMNSYALESAVLRARKIDASGKSSEHAHEMAKVFGRDVLDIVEGAAKTVLAACSEGDALRMNLSVLKRFTKAEAVDVIGLRKRIAARLIDAEKFFV
jgi:hypothetical protein